jgi:glycosyltransferase involved in cell wall biosynthesis
VKPTVIHIIHNLGRGGAETMLVESLDELRQYHNVVVVLTPNNHFGEIPGADAIHCVRMNRIWQIPGAILRFRRLFQRYSVALVHSHLLWPTVVARLGTPRSIPLVSTVHAFVKSSVEYQRYYLRMIERCSYRFRSSAILAVAEGARKEYFELLGLTPRNSKTVYTFVDPRKFQPAPAMRSATTPFRLISVGALRTQKNYRWLVDLLAHWDGPPLQVDIYGGGLLYDSLQAQIEATQAPIRLCGEVTDIPARLHQYDGMVMCSLYEGFSLGVLEAMASGLPLLLSDIPSFREQAAGTATYFPLHDKPLAKYQFIQFIQGHEQRAEQRQQALERVLAQFTLKRYHQEIDQCYQQLMAGQPLSNP